MRHQRRIRINAPQRRVWSLIDDESQLPLWLPNVVSTRYPDGKPKGDRTGARFVQEMREGEKISSYQGEVTAYHPGRLLGVLMLPEALAVHTVYDVEGDEDWTLLAYGCDVKPRTLKGHLILWLSKKMLTDILDQQLLRLKLVAEGKAADL